MVPVCLRNLRRGLDGLSRAAMLVRSIANIVCLSDLSDKSTKVLFVSC